MKASVAKSWCAIVALVVGGLAVPAAAAAPAVSRTTVGVTPAAFTPWLRSDTPDQNVRRLVPCGTFMYAVGRITDIQRGSTVYVRSNAFRFSQKNGNVSRWAPRVNGPVNDIALSPDCSIAYLGGNFTRVNGVSATNLVAVNTSTGAVIKTFRHYANEPVSTVDYTHKQVLVGGAFSRINGVARTELASLFQFTGKVTRYASFAISGSYPNTTPHVDNSQISHDGRKLLVEGVFTSIAGRPRSQVAMFDLGPDAASLSTWHAPETTNACNVHESYYIRAGAWSPDDQTVYFASTGYKPRTGPGSTTAEPRGGLCDAAFAIPSAAGAQYTQWVNYTGCDSYYGIVAGTADIYVTGHERWANNSYGCDHQGVGAVDRPGLADLDPTQSGTVNPDWNPTRSLGHGGDDLVLTTAGLWIASDNGKLGHSQMCGKVYGNKGGICFLPYAS